MNLEASKKIALEFIAKQEGLYSAVKGSLKPVQYNAPDNTPIYSYWDSYGKVYTIGYGSTYDLKGNKFDANSVITKKEADELLMKVINDIHNYLKTKYDISKLNENQYAAMISISYNMGQYGFVKTKVGKAIAEGQPIDYIAQVWKDTATTSGGQRLGGLVKRRTAESNLFSTPASIVQNLTKGKGGVALAIGIILLAGGLSFFLYSRFNKR